MDDEKKGLLFRLDDIVKYMQYYLICTKNLLYTNNFEICTKKSTSFK
jgi:hypothetical protein